MAKFTYPPRRPLISLNRSLTDVVISLCEIKSFAILVTRNPIKTTESRGVSTIRMHYANKHP
jgi:hypothetical protein